MTGSLPGASESEMRDLSPTAAAQMLGVSRSLVYRLVERGELRAYRVSNRLRIPRSSVDELRERNRVHPQSGPAYDLVLRSHRRRASATFSADLSTIPLGRSA